jgi:hypothetical protein
VTTPPLLVGHAHFQGLDRDGTLLVTNDGKRLIASVDATGAVQHRVGQVSTSLLAAERPE